jgi:hypothetical protein
MEVTEKKEPNEKDFWDKADIIFRPLNGLLTALAVGLLGYYTSGILRNQEAQQTNERVYTELMSSRELADSGLRKDMFLSIIETFQRPEASGLEPKMLNLELLTYNFHDSLNLKPLFAHMDRQIAASNDASKAEYTTRLNQVAKEIVTRQLVLLEQVGQTFRRTIDFGKLKASGYLELEPKTLRLGNVDREFMLSVYASPDTRSISMEMGIRTPQESSEMQIRKFRVGYYDFPMIDNTGLSGDQRAAVVLTQSNEETAEVTLVYFPGSYASLKERVSYDVVVEKLRNLGEGQ